MELLRSACLDAVHRYRRSHLAQHASGHCRFEPSCSAFALETLESRALPLALLSIAWRLVRCNPLSRAGTKDPVRSPRRHQARPNALRTTCAVLFIGGAFVVMMTGLAFGQGISGGCRGTANGRPPARLTQNNPLRVGRGENVNIQGTAPGGRARGQTVLDYNISFISGIFETDARSELHGEGGRWQGTVKVDQYLNYGSGLYEVTGNVTTTQSSYDCPVTFYVFLDGNKAVGIGGAVLAGAGALGTAAAGRGKAPVGDSEPRPEPDDAQKKVDDLGRDAAKDFLGVQKDRPANVVNSVASWGCLLAFFIALFEEADFLIGSLIPLAAMRSGSSKNRRVWTKGKPVLGFFSGLFMGLGATVAAHQFGLWPLTMMTAIAFPLLCAVVGTVRGLRGTAYKVG